MYAEAEAEVEARRVHSGARTQISVRNFQA